MRLSKAGPKLISSHRQGPELIQFLIKGLLDLIAGQKWGVDCPCDDPFRDAPPA